MRANEFLIEEVNPDCLNPAFNDTQYMDGLTYRATADEEKNGLKYFQIKVFDDNFEKVGIAKFAPKKDANGNSWLESLITAVHPEHNGKGIARNIYAYVRMLGNTIRPSGDQSQQGRAMWQSWKKSGDAEHLMKENFADGKHPEDKGDSKRLGVPTKASVSTLRKVAKQGGRKGQLAHWLANMKSGRAKHKSESVADNLTELFDPKTSFPLQWDNQFAGSGEVHAEAYDADGRVIHISFTPTGDAGVIEIVFSRGGSYDLTGHGDASRVLATVVNAINIYLQKYRPPYIAFSAKTTGGRSGAYTAMIRRLAHNYTLLTPQDYPEDEEVIDFLNSLGNSDKPFILARS